MMPPRPPSQGYNERMLTDDDPAIVRRYGRMMMLGAGLASALYIIGLARRSYLALALPVTIVVGGGLAAAAMLGRVLSTTPDEPPDPR